MARFDRNFYNSIDWLKIRAKVLKRDNYQCVKCGVSVREKRKSRVDHIQPRRDRPDLSFDMSNLQTLCIRCDNHKHHEKMHPGAGEYKIVEIGVDGLPVDPNDPWYSAG